ncbi:MAG TPA: FAD-binding oxidoreductase [Acidimicrobiia bacterium]|nr:FAD-binding oxidoreductase [Acidimicrobiia bacterium]
MDPERLADSIVGEVLTPGESGFDEARALWNVRFDRKPDLIARCTSHDDVVAAIAYAKAEGIDLSVRGGGHNYAAKTVAEGGLLVDLSAMKDIEVELEARTARIGPGVTGEELDAATQQHGLAVPIPTVSSVGVVGAALGGGTGYLSRKYGITADNVISIDAVTSDGRPVTASADENPDLFWAMRGGGGNFAVATSMLLGLHEVGPEVLAGQILYPFDGAGDHLRFFRDFMERAPREFQCYPFTFRVPPIKLFPEEYHGEPVLDFVFYHEDPDAADFVQPLRELGAKVLDFVAPGPYVDVQKSFDANLPKGQRYYSKAHDLAGLTDGAIDTMVEFVPQMVGALSAAYFDPAGGAIGDVAVSATAYAGRETRYGFHIIAGWFDESEDESVMTWASQFHAAMATHATGGVYVNLIADDEADRVSAAYGDNYTRLIELKQKWDPTNVFSNNYNIPPD